MGVLAKPIPFGDYFLLEKLNTGGMAEVFKAKTFGVEGFERIVAVKKILPSIAEDKEFISMFIDEAKIAGQLTHANIAQIFDLGNINDEYYIALEYVAGHDLRVIYDRCVRTNRKLDIGCVCYIISKICEGLDYAHNKRDANGELMGIIHRDISPQNMLISYEGDCKLIDFGIAKASNKSSATQVGILKGKFSYMSPEQVSGKTNIDRRSDIFALGIVLFEMLTLKRLFLGASDFETLEKIRKVELSPPTLYNSDIPEELEDIVMKALEKDVTQRYQTCAELQQALQKFMFTHNIYYTAKELSEFMRSMFAQEIALEQKKMEFYRELTRDVLIQSKQPSANLEDETSFYDRQNVPKMSGVQYEAAVVQTAQPAPKQAIYAELDDFQPPNEGIVYSPKQAVNSPNVIDSVNVNDIVSASVNSGKAHPSARKSMASMDAVVVNKNRETIMTTPVEKKQNGEKRGAFIAIAIVLFIVILILIGLISGKGSLFDKHDGKVRFDIYPENVKVSVEINHEKTGDNLTKSFNISDLSTNTETAYRISAPNYKDFEGTIMATGEGALVEINLESLIVPKAKVFVDVDGADVYIDDAHQVGDNRQFESEELSIGDHVLRVVKEGYKPEKRTIKVETGREIEPIHVKLRPAIATLVIKTEPYNASYILKNLRTGDIVSKDNTKAGVARISNLPVDTDYQIVIYDGKEERIESWKPRPGALPTEDQVRTFTIKTDPDAVAVAAAPAPVQQPVAAPAPAPEKETKTASAGSSKSTTPKPKKTESEKKAPAPAAPVAKPTPVVSSDAPGVLQIAGKPPCTVTIKGKSYGSTPIKYLEVAAGTYTIKCASADSSDEKTVTVGSGETKKVMFTR